jgi:starch synthase (maltosyl-transferring)
LIGAGLIEAAVAAALPEDQPRLQDWVLRLRHGEAGRHVQQICEDPELAQLMARNGPRDFATRLDRELEVTVDRERARFSTWYELFPRSAAPAPGRHGTFQDVEARLPYVASMGFDVLYLPPIHPVGRDHRKGKNNAVTAAPDDVGSPWAIGAKEGGHKAIHPELGTLDDFRRLVRASRDYGIEIALDVAFQCSPDHPYVQEHPEWFRHRPDGTIQYAENPPKKYQDIYPFDFECRDWRGLWEELKSVFTYWMDQGVRIFRVDNPHTKPFTFWEWCLAEVRRAAPDVMFLAEAFTRPKIMYRLAKLGFTQSYTYYAWRNTKQELTAYLTELTQTDVAEFFRPNLWPNTPDILTERLQVGGRPAFMMRLVLAATLGASYGIYGPPFEHGWSAPREPGSEEYLHSEKYQIHHHDLARPDSLKDFIGRVNKIRREHTALQTNRTLQFLPIDNDQLLAYCKLSENGKEILVMVVNLDPQFRHSGWLELPLADLGLTERPYQMHDLLGGARYLWQGPRNFVQLDPHVVPAHIFRLRRQVRTERDFEYYM